MKNNPRDTNLLSTFFTKEAAHAPGIREGGGLSAKYTAGLTIARVSNLPVLPAAAVATDEERRAYWRTLRAFFRSGKGGALPIDAEGTHCYPALLAPYRNRPHMERNFPLWMEETQDGQTMPLHEVLTEVITRFAPDEKEAKILKDNLLRLEVIVGEKIRFAEDAYQANAVIDDALETLKVQLDIRGEEGNNFEKDLASLRKGIPEQGLLIPFSPNAPVYILAAVVREQLTGKRKALREKILHLLGQLKDILAVERKKSPEARSPEKLRGALDFAESFFNFNELSSVIPAGGSVMPEARLLRIEKIVATLENTKADFFQKNAFVILCEKLAESTAPDWERTFDKSTVLVAPPEQDCHLTAQIFDKKMAEYAEIFAAIRTAELEINDQYSQAIHRDFFAHFNWRSFTGEEIGVCPPVILLTKDNTLVENELNEFSRLLSSNRPVKLLVLNQGGRETAKDFTFRQEPGAIAVAHRNTYVLQTASVASGKLVEGFREGMNSPSPAMFYIYAPTGREQTLSGANLWTSAAVEGREFPGFKYNSEQGTRWGSRFNILHNPQPESDWPIHKMAYQHDSGEETVLEVPFTFADFAAQDARYAGMFHPVPPEFWSDDLVPIGDYLSLPPEELYAKVPFVWMVNEKNHLQKAAVSWPLVLTCRERLDFWHFLQENAGIHSYHVEQATERLRREMEDVAAEKIANLQAAHAAALDQVKEEEGRAAMERLAAVLLDLDTTELVSQSVTPSKPTSGSMKSTDVPIEDAPEQKTEEEEEEILTLGEPWIDTPLCTSCNDCININKRLFKYDENKQAYIADVNVGTFRDLVLAAEKCPVSIIHPGAPANKDEPGLEELVKRAERFS